MHRPPSQWERAFLLVVAKCLRINYNIICVLNVLQYYIIIIMNYELRGSVVHTGKYIIMAIHV